ncbi:MAG: hypothetical protein ACO3O9_04820 [Candidatus Nanopelagicales bacterium]
MNNLSNIFYHYAYQGLEKEGVVPRVKTILVSILMSCLITLSGSPGQAQDLCNTFNSELDSALTTFSSDGRFVQSERKILKSLKKEAERVRNNCIKEINKDFSRELKQINKRFLNLSKSGKKKTGTELEKSILISNAIMTRDSRVQSLPSVSVIPKMPRKKG